MTRTSIISFMALTIGIGGALAAGIGLEDQGAYSLSSTVLEKTEAQTYAASLFARADANQDNTLDADEYAALSIVTAELSLLNGFLSFGTGENVKTVALPIEAPTALTLGERARLEAISRNEFYVAAGEDGVMSGDEFVSLKSANFAQADRNRNGTLVKSELVAFAASEAKVIASGV